MNFEHETLGHSVVWCRKTGADIGRLGNRMIDRLEQIHGGGK